jgi:hypothetical protein
MTQAGRERREQREAERSARRAGIDYRQSPGTPYTSRVPRERRFQIRWWA